MAVAWIFVCDEAGRWQWVCRDKDGRLRKAAQSFPEKEACAADATRHGWNGVNEALIDQRGGHGRRQE